MQGIIRANCGREFTAYGQKNSKNRYPILQMSKEDSGFIISAGRTHGFPKSPFPRRRNSAVDAAPVRLANSPL